jgi:hypothetical protein
MSKPLVDRIPFAKILIGLTIAFGLSLGLCGVSLALSWRGKVPAGMDQLVDRAAGAEILGMVLSAVGIAVMAAVWVVMTVVTSLTRRGAEPEAPIDEKDDAGRKDPR